MSHASTYDKIAELADKAANLHAASKLRLPPAIHVDMLSSGMAEIRDGLRLCFQELTDENPWEFEPPNDDRRGGKGMRK